MKHLCSTFHVSNDMAWSQMKLIAVANGFTLMDQNRYGAILSSLQGFDQHQHVAIEEEETWMEQNNIYTKSSQLSNYF